MRRWNRRRVSPEVSGIRPSPFSLVITRGGLYVLAGAKVRASLGRGQRARCPGEPVVGPKRQRSRPAAATTSMHLPPPPAPPRRPPQPVTARTRQRRRRHSFRAPRQSHAVAHDFSIEKAWSHWPGSRGRCCEVHSPADRAVDLFPKNVGMTGVPAGLFDHVHQDPSQGHGPGATALRFAGWVRSAASATIRLLTVTAI